MCSCTVYQSKHFRWTGNKRAGNDKWCNDAGGQNRTGTRTEMDVRNECDLVPKMLGKRKFPSPALTKIEIGSMCVDGSRIEKVFINLNCMHWQRWKLNCVPKSVLCVALYVDALVCERRLLLLYSGGVLYKSGKSLVNGYYEWHTFPLEFRLGFVWTKAI